MMAQQQEEMMQQMENMLNNLGNNTQLNILINVNFRVSGSASQPISLVTVQSNPEEKFSLLLKNIEINLMIMMIQKNLFLMRRI